jgi:hypothetical protein
MPQPGSAASTPAAAPPLGVAAARGPAVSAAGSLVVPLVGLALLALIAAGFAARSRVARDLEARWPDG